MAGVLVVAIGFGIWGVKTGKVKIRAEYDPNKAYVSGIVKVENLCNRNFNNYQIAISPTDEGGGEGPLLKDVNSEGKFGFELKPGGYIVTAISVCPADEVGKGCGACFSVNQWITVASGDRKSLTFIADMGGSSRVSIAVSNACSGALLPNANIVYYDTHGERHETTSGATGVADLGVLELGSLAVTASKSGYNFNSNNFPVGACDSRTFSLALIPTNGCPTPTPTRTPTPTKTPTPTSSTCRANGSGCSTGSQCCSGKCSLGKCKL